MRKKLVLLVAIVLCCVLFVGCQETDDATGGDIVPTRKKVSSNELQFVTPEKGDTIVVFTTELGEFSAVLYPENAPQACDNFIGLVGDGFYDGTSVYRVIDGFCVQAGLDENGHSTTIWNGNGYPAETSDVLHHYAGALCMAVDEEGMAGSPFYVVQASTEDVTEEMRVAMQEAGYREDVIATYLRAGGVPYLDYTDTVFGQIYEGMDVIDQIAMMETDETDAPIKEILIDSVSIGTYS